MIDIIFVPIGLIKKPSAWGGQLCLHRRKPNCYEKQQVNNRMERDKVK
jgi:hypothetical protein